MSQLYNDPRWVALHSGQSPCPACGDIHQGLFDLVCDKPDVWLPAHQPAQDAGPAATGQPGEDHCIVADGYYLRADLHIPLLGAPGMSLTFGLWAAVSPTDYERHMAWRETAASCKPRAFFGWLANRVPGYDDTLNVACRIQPRIELPPFIIMLESNHSLTIEQQRGITFSRVLDLYALNGHDLRTELLVPVSEAETLAASRRKLSDFGAIDGIGLEVPGSQGQLGHADKLISHEDA